MTVPTGWQRVAIKEVYEGLFDGPHATPPTADEGPVFLGIKNITDDGHLLLSEVRHIAEDDFPRWTKRVTPQAGDIVFTYEATLNRYAIIPPDFRGCLGRRLALIRPNVELVDTRFLHYYFFSRDWRETIEANKLAGATVDRVPLTHFPNFPINLPPLATQRRIASILSTYDDLIENNTRRIAILEEMARRLYEEWFVHFRFPGHEDATFTETEHGRVPEGWEIKELGEVADVRWGDTNTTKKAYVDQGYTAYSAAGPDGFLPYHDFSRKGVVVSAIGAHCGLTWFARGNWSCIKNTMRLWSSSDGLSDEYLYFATEGKDTWPKRGAAQPFISQGDARARKLIVPPEGVEGQFRRLAIPSLDFADNLRKKNTNLRTQRDLLLPKLVSGEIDVSEAEENLEDAVA